MRIGLIGEAPNDTTAIRNLLSKNYKDLKFIPLLDRITGDMLDSKGALERLRKEYLAEKPDLIIFIRDLDALEKGGKSKIKEREKSFNVLNKIVNGIGVFLLNIYELEALIFADISTFNKYYGCSIAEVSDPMEVYDPKGYLIKVTRSAEKQFKVTHNPEIFSLLKFNAVKANCRYFASFLEEFDKAISA